MNHEMASPDMLAAPPIHELKELQQQAVEAQNEREAAAHARQAAYESAVVAEHKDRQRSIHERMAELADPNNDDPFRDSKRLQLEADLSEARQRPHSGPTPVYKGRGEVIGYDQNGERITAGQVADFEGATKTPEETRAEQDIDPAAEAAAMETDNEWLKDLYNTHQQLRAEGKDPRLGLTPEEESIYQSYADRRILADARQERIEAGDVRTRSEAVDYLRHIEREYGADSDEAAVALAKVGGHLSTKQNLGFREHGKRESEERQRLAAMSPREVVSLSPEEAQRIAKKYPHLEGLLMTKAQEGTEQIADEIMAMQFADFVHLPQDQQRAALEWLERSDPESYKEMVRRAEQHTHRLDQEAEDRFAREREMAARRRAPWRAPEVAPNTHPDGEEEPAGSWSQIPPPSGRPNNAPTSPDGDVRVAGGRPQEQDDHLIPGMGGQPRRPVPSPPTEPLPRGRERAPRRGRPTRRQRLGAFLGATAAAVAGVAGTGAVAYRAAETTPGRPASTANSPQAPRGNTPKA